MRTNSLTWYLNEYYKWQEEIILVSRPTGGSWSNRCTFLDDEYSARKHYNHRSLLINEVVIEYDYDDLSLNSELARRVSAKLKNAGYSNARWHSGNKSHHIHFFIDIRESKNIALLKSIVMRDFGIFYRNDKGHFIKEYIEGCEVLMPDMRLASTTHLIRAEYGLHEKTGKNKRLIYKTEDYPSVNDLTDDIWERYGNKQRANIKRSMTMTTKDLKDSNLVKKLLDTTNFRETVGDGRERIMFCLIHLIRHKYSTKEELTKYLWEWYRYTGGYKMTEWDVRNKVRYHWPRQYNITHVYLSRVYEDVTGKELNMEED